MTKLSNVMLLGLFALMVSPSWASLEHGSEDLRRGPSNGAALVEDSVARMRVVISDFAASTIAPGAADKIPLDYVIKYFGLTTPQGILDFEKTYHDSLPKIIQLGMFKGIFDENFVRAQQTIQKQMNDSTLSLDRAGLKAVPLEILQMKNLTELSLEGNAISQFPEVLTRMEKLSVLNLNHNSIRDLPNSLTRMSSLQTLRLAHNQLDGLPQSIGSLTSLKVLDLSNNHLELIPSSIMNLKASLRELNLRGNHLYVHELRVGPSTIKPAEQISQFAKGLPYTTIYLSDQTPAKHISDANLRNEITKGQAWLNKFYGTIRPASAAPTISGLPIQDKQAQEKARRERLQRENYQRYLINEGKAVTTHEQPQIIEEYNPNPEKPGIPLLEKREEAPWWWPF